MDKLIKQIYTKDLSGVDVDKITRGKAKIYLYKDLEKFNNIYELLGRNQMIILLFPVQSDVSGHWIACLFHKATNTIEHFDPYGLSYKQEMSYTKNQYVRENLLGKLYDKAIDEGYKVVSNPYKFQKFDSTIDTCGRHSAIRLRFHYLDVDEYAKIFMGQKLSADYLVTIMTLLTLKEDSKDEEMFIRDAT